MGRKCKVLNLKSDCIYSAFPGLGVAVIINIKCQNTVTAVHWRAEHSVSTKDGLEAVSTDVAGYSNRRGRQRNLPTAQRLVPYHEAWGWVTFTANMLAVLESRVLLYFSHQQTTRKKIKGTFFVFLYYNSDLGCKWHLIKTRILFSVWHELDFRVQDNESAWEIFCFLDLMNRTVEP